MRVLSAVASVVVLATWTTEMWSAAALACRRTSVQAASATEWRAVCEDGGASVAFDPTHVKTFFLTHDADVRVSAARHEVFLSSTLAKVDELVSSSVSSFMLRAESRWVHKTPVNIAPTAFAKLTALETLTLQDVPLANPSLHLVLPRTIKKITIVGCKLERFSFEMADGGTASALTEIDLHANNLAEIPEAFYSLPATTINLDIRLNKLSAISVSVSHLAALQQWMTKGVLQVDNQKNPCPLSDKSTDVQGVSQVFTVCVSETAATSNVGNARSFDFAPRSNGRHNTSKANSTDAANEAIDDSPGTVHSPINDSDGVLPKPKNRQAAPEQEDTVTKTESQPAHAPAIYVALICLSVVSAMLLVFSFVLIVARHRQQSHARNRGKSSSSLLTSAASEDLSMSRMGRKASNASDASSDNFVTPLPDFNNNPMMNRPGRSFTETPASATSTHRGGSSLYTTMASPHSKSCGYIMTKSMQVLTGVSNFSAASHEKQSELRRANKDKIRAVLSDIASKRGTIEVNKRILTCHGEVVETEAGAFRVDCHVAGFLAEQEGAVPKPLALKVYVEQDVRTAIKEYRALLVMQSNTCRQFVSQMVTTDMEKELGGLKCAVLVVERGSATTFRHVVRGQIDRTKQFEVVQQLHAVVKALECLHERQFIHGGLHLDALMVHSFQANRLRFRDLEHAARFGDIVLGANTTALLEYVPPEMARHLVCSGLAPRRSSLDTITADSYQVLRASASYDVWCLGILILKIYANSKHLDEFRGCDTPDDFYMKLSDDAFDFERSLELYVHHEEVRDLARVCLRRDPRKRPKLTGILMHRVFRAYDRLGESDLVASFNASRLQAEHKTREVVPPTLWLFLPPRDLGLAKTRTVDEWVSDIATHQQHQRQTGRLRSGELMFPLLFLCENSQHVNSPCSNTGFHNSRLHLPASLLSLAMPLVHETTLFLEAKSILSEKPQLDISEISGLGTHQWAELVKFYRALEKMMVAPISSFSLLLLKPLEEMLALKDPGVACQVLDELKCLIFSQEKRDHVLSILDILRTLSINSNLDERSEAANEDDDLASVSDDSDVLSSLSKEWSRLRKCEIDAEASTPLPPARWLCRRHWECEMECEV